MRLPATDLPFEKEDYMSVKFQSNLPGIRLPAEDETERLFVCLARLSAFLDNPTREPDSEEVHLLKALLYGQIEKAGFNGERYFYLQRQLRELFNIVIESGDPRDYERHVGLAIIREIRAKYRRLAGRPGD